MSKSWDFIDFRSWGVQNGCKSWKTMFYAFCLFTPLYWRYKLSRDLQTIDLEEIYRLVSKILNFIPCGSVLGRFSVSCKNFVGSASKILWKFYRNSIEILFKIYRNYFETLSNYDWNSIEILSKFYWNSIETLLKFFRNSTESPLKTLDSNSNEYIWGLDGAKKRKCWKSIGFTTTFWRVKSATATPKPRTTERAEGSGRG